MIFFSPAKNVERLLRVDVSVVIVDFFERKIAFSNSLRVYAYFLCSRLSIQPSLHTINVSKCKCKCKCFVYRRSALSYQASLQALHC